MKAAWPRGPGRPKRPSRRVPWVAGVAVALVVALGGLWFANLRAAAALRERLWAIDQGALPGMLKAHRLALDLDRLRFHSSRLLLGLPFASERESRLLLSDLAALRADAAHYGSFSDSALEGRLWEEVSGELSNVERRIPGLLAPRPTWSLGSPPDVGFRDDVLDLERGCDQLVAIGEHEAELQSALLRAEASRARRLQFESAAGFALLLLGFLWWARVREERHVRELADYSTALERVNVELEAFAGRVAHDLRAPLAPIQGNAALIAKGVDPERSRELAARIVRTTGRLAELVDGLLSFATGQRLGQGICDAAEVLGGVLADSADRLRATGAVLRVSSRPTPVACARPLVASVLQNLIDNALKYGARAGQPARVEVVVEALGSEALLAVSDDGEGMADEVRLRAFEPFFRGGRGHGAGLGLATVQRIVLAHGGTLSLESAPGLGTRCRVLLPLMAEPIARA